MFSGAVFIMEDQKLKKRPFSVENEGHVAPKRLHQEVKRDLNSTESPLPSSSTYKVNPFFSVSELFVIQLIALRN